MAETAKYNLNDAALDNGTIDFYILLGESQSANEDVLRSKINALYSEAQANRDHRNLNRRREYQTLLELLPAARAALLEAPKRESYDAYLEAARAGHAEPDFETFMNDLMGFGDQHMEEKTGLLGVQDEPRARVVKSPQGAEKVSTKGMSQGRSTPAPASTSGAGSTSGGAGGKALIGAVVGLIVGFALVYLISQNFIIAALVGLVLAAIAFFILNSQGPRRVGL